MYKIEIEQPHSPEPKKIEIKDRTEAYKKVTELKKTFSSPVIIRLTETKDDVDQCVTVYEFDSVNGWTNDKKYLDR